MMEDAQYPERVDKFDDFTEILFQETVNYFRADVRYNDGPHESGLFAEDAWKIIDDTAGPLVKWWAGSDRRWFTLLQGRGDEVESDGQGGASIEGKG